MFTYRRLNTVNMPILSNLLSRFNAIPIKIRASYFEDIAKVILKFILGNKRLAIVNTIAGHQQRIDIMSLQDLL